MPVRSVLLSVGQDTPLCLLKCCRNRNRGSLERDIDGRTIDLWAELRVCPFPRVHAQLELVYPSMQSRAIQPGRGRRVYQRDDAIGQCIHPTN